MKDGQESEKEFCRFLNIALNSAVELEYHLMVARDIHAISDTEANSLVCEVVEVRRMLQGLIKKVRANR